MSMRTRCARRKSACIRSGPSRPPVHRLPGAIMEQAIAAFEEPNRPPAVFTASASASLSSNAEDAVMRGERRHSIAILEAHRDDRKQLMREISGALVFRLRTHLVHC